MRKTNDNNDYNSYNSSGIYHINKPDSSNFKTVSGDNVLESTEDNGMRICVYMLVLISLVVMTVLTH